MMDASPLGNTGGLVLRGDVHVIEGPAGTQRLSLQAFRVAARLLQVPGAIVSDDALLMAMYPDADDEPDSSAEILRLRIQQLRSAIQVVTAGAMEIRTARGMGRGIVEAGR